MSLDWATLRTVAEMTDDVGVLSVYLNLDPHWRGESSANPPWQVRLRQDLAAVREDAKQQLPREHHKLVTQRIDALTPQLDQLRDPTAPGQGRALFAGVTSNEVHIVSLQVPLVDRVKLQQSAHVRPLVDAWQHAGPTGTIAVSADDIKMIDMRFGWTDEVAVIHYTNPSEQRLLAGPPANNPALHQHNAPQHDLFERREEEKLHRFLQTFGDRIVSYATDREWQHLALTGEAHLVQSVTEGLPVQWAERVIALHHPVTQLTTPKLVATVEPALATARQQQRQDLARRVYEAAMSANAGACGLGETLDGLQQGRVAHLVLQADGTWPGSRSPDGWLVPAGEVPPGADPQTMIAVADLCDSMIQLAFSSGAAVTALPADDIGQLAPFDGIGALLRW